MKKTIPFLFPASLLLLICIAAYVRLTSSAVIRAGRPVDCEMLLILACLLWTWYEITATKNETEQKSRESDRGTRGLYVMAQAGPIHMVGPS